MEGDAREADRLEEVVARLVALASPEEGTSARRLPPERDLVDALGISRGALRQDLLVLERLGFLHRTQGRGTYIDTPRDDFVRSYFTISRMFGHLTDEQFAQSRAMLEESAAGAAARRRSDAVVHDLRELVDRMVAATKSGDHAAAFEADVAFHRRLQEAVDNPVLRLMHEGLSHVLRETVRSRRLEAIAVEEPDAEGVLRTDSVHYPIVDAIAAGDEEAARAAMREHFRNWQMLHEPRPAAASSPIG